MTATGRFMIIKQPSGDNDKRPTELAPDDARMTYFWTWFNVLQLVESAACPM